MTLAIDPDPALPFPLAEWVALLHCRLANARREDGHDDALVQLVRQTMRAAAWYLPEEAVDLWGV